MYIGLTEIILQGFIIEKIARRLSDAKIIVVGIFCMALGMLILPLIPTFLMFIASITLIASGIGALLTATRSIVSKKSSANEQGNTMGMTNSVSSIGTILGPIIGGFLFDFFGPSIPFLVNVTLLMVALMLSLNLIKNNKKQR
jgi:MFS family permease